MSLPAAMSFDQPMSNQTTNTRFSSPTSASKTKRKGKTKMKSSMAIKLPSRRSSASLQPFPSPSTDNLFPFDSNSMPPMGNFIDQRPANAPPQSDPLESSAAFLPLTPINPVRSSSFTSDNAGAINSTMPKASFHQASRFNSPSLHHTDQFHQLHQSLVLDVPGLSAHDFPFHPALLNFSPDRIRPGDPSSLDMLHSHDPFEDSPLLPPTAHFSVLSETSLPSSLAPSLGPQLASPLGPSFLPHTPPNLSLAGGLAIDLSPTMAPAANAPHVGSPAAAAAAFPEIAPSNPSSDYAHNNPQLVYADPVLDNIDTATTADTIPGEPSPELPSQSTFDRFYHEQPQYDGITFESLVNDSKLHEFPQNDENTFSLDEFLRDEPFPSLTKHFFNIDLGSVRKAPPKSEPTSSKSRSFPEKLPKQRNSSAPRSASSSGPYSRQPSSKNIPKSSSFSTGYRRQFTPSSSEPSFSFEDCSNEFHVGEGNYSFQDETARLSMQLGPALHMKKRTPFKNQKTPTKSVLKKSRTFSNLCLAQNSPNSSHTLPPAPKTLKNMESGLVSFQLDLKSRR